MIPTKEKSLQVLIKELDGIFSDFVRMRDSENGRVKCFICGFSMPWRMSQNMHYIDRDQMPTRYDEDNCHAGCQSCNCFNPDHSNEYECALVAKLGTKMVHLLLKKSKSLAKFMRSDLVDLIEFYKERVRVLKKDKNL